MKKQLTTRQNIIVLNACSELLDRIFLKKNVMAKFLGMRSRELLNSKLRRSSQFTKKQVKQFYNNLINVRLLLDDSFDAGLRNFLLRIDVKNPLMFKNLFRSETRLISKILKDLKNILEGK